MKATTGAIQCPTCGARAMRRVERDVTVRAGKRTIVVHAIAIEECSKCGERMYDLAAFRRIEDAKRNTRRRRAACPPVSSPA